MNREPNTSNIRRGVQRAVALGFALSVGAAACNSDASSTTKHAQAIEQQTKETMEERGELMVMPGYLEADKNVIVHSTPANIRTVNNAMITGNEAGTGRIVLERPLIISKPEGDAPHYWAGGMWNGNLVWVAINDDNSEHLNYYTKTGADDSTAQFCDGQLTGLYKGEITESGNVLTINPDGIAKTVGQAIWSTQDIDNLHRTLLVQGYESTPLVC